MVAALADSLWRSEDGGQTWQRAPGVPGGITALAIHPEQRQLLFAGTANGRLFRSTDGGASWQPSR